MVIFEEQNGIETTWCSMRMKNRMKCSVGDTRKRVAECR